MKQVNELSPRTAMKASDAASLRGDIRGKSLGSKFSDYARSKIHHLPDILLTTPSNKESTKVSIKDVKKVSDGLSVDVMTDGGSSFSIHINTRNKPFIIDVPVGSGKYAQGSIDRRGAVILSKIAQKVLQGVNPQPPQKINPTDFSLNDLRVKSSQPISQKPSPEYTIENLMKEDLKVQRFSLKQIVENLDKIQEKTGKFGEPSNTLAPKEKKRMLELMGRFNKHGQSLRGDQAIQEAARELSEMAEMAKKYAMNENNSDFIQKETVQRDFKQMDGIVKEFQKLAQECVNRQMQLSALYEDYGNVMERYYSMESINETGNTPMPEDVQTNLGMSECGTCGCGNPHDTHGQTDTETTPNALLSQEDEEGMM